MAETITNVSVGIVTGERTKINSATIKNGRIYFSKDTGELFYDWNDERVQVCPQTAPNNGTLTIKQNSSTLGTFTANQAGNTEVNITVPSLSELDASYTATGNNAIVGIGQVDGKITTVKYDTFAKQSDIPDMTNYVTTSQYNTNMPNNFSGVYVWPNSTASSSVNISPDTSKGGLAFKAGTNVTLVGSASNHNSTVTINAVDTTYSAGDGININTNNQISSATNIKVKVGDSSFLVPTGGSNPGILDISAGPNVTISPDVNAKRITVAASGFVQGDGISIIKSITQSAYEVLATKDPSTVYIVTADLD